MIDNPEAYGFTWGHGPLEKNETIVHKAAPYIIHGSVELMSEHFGPTYFLDMANGTSGRVRDQALRNELWGNLPLRSNEREMKRWVIERALKVAGRKRGTRTVFRGMDGKDYPSTVEMNAANLAHLIDHGVDPVVARTMLGL
jgi:hypothetical protein